LLQATLEWTSELLELVQELPLCLFQLPTPKQRILNIYIVSFKNKCHQWNLLVHRQSQFLTNLSLVLDKQQIDVSWRLQSTEKLKNWKIETINTEHELLDSMKSDYYKMKQWKR
jgi:hypothetical protein